LRRELLGRHAVEDSHSTVGPQETSAETGTLTLSSFAEGRSIGPYRITGKIGSGGMGTVFRAVRDDQQFRKEVAIKALLFSADESLISRFRYERHALAAMDHPNIAKVLDAGASDAGELYLVMELVDGKPLTVYADRHRLSIRERLQLLIPVCKAVQHAHQKGIIHRDLKPSNVLVTVIDGVSTPKVIDFGVAKAVHGLAIAGPTMHTQLGTAVGTLEYMSPEQTGLSDDRVDTRSDVYSLGVILYELLAGSTPLKRGDSVVDFVRRLSEEEPQPLSARVRSLGPDAGKIASQRSTEVARLTRALTGEIDWIAAKALEKDPERRYESANALALDIERYLNGDPVRASPLTTRYRIRKFVRKHRLAFAVVIAFVAILTGAAAVSTWEAVKARRAGEVAEAVSTFLREDVLSQANPEAQSSGDKPNPQLTVRDALDRAAASIGPRFRGKPLVEAAIRRTIGESYLALGQFDSAIQQLRRAFDLFSQTRGPKDQETLALKGRLGEATWRGGNIQDGIALLSQTVDSLKSVEGADGDDTLSSIQNLADAYIALGQHRKAVELLEPATRIMERKYGPESRGVLEAITILVNAYTRNGDVTRAIETQEKALAIQRRVVGPDHPDTLVSANNLAVAYYQAGQYDKAEPLYADTAERQSRTIGPRHPSTLTTKNNLSQVYSSTGQWPRSLVLLNEVYQAFRDSLGADNLNTLVAGHNVASNYTFQGRYQDAEQLFFEVIAGLKRTVAADHPQRLYSEDGLAVVYRCQGKYAQAEEIETRVVAAARKTLGPDNPQTFVSMGRLAATFAAMGRNTDAEKLDLETITAMRRVQGASHPRTLFLSNHLALLYWKQHKFDQAIALLREIQPSFDKALPDHWQRFHSQSLLGMSLIAAGQPAEGEPLLRTGFAGMMRRKETISVPDRDYLDRVANAAAALATR